TGVVAAWATACNVAGSTNVIKVETVETSRTPSRAREHRRPMPAPAKKRRRRRPRRAVLVRRWLGVGALCLVGLLYYSPLHTYVDTRHTLVQRSAEVRSLRNERRQ